MLDSFVRPVIDPPLNRIAQILATFSLTPNMLSVIGFGFGLTACLFIYLQIYFAALIFLILNRAADGLDGPLARFKKTSSDFGGYLDIVLDFLFYAAFPFSAALGIGTDQALAAGGFILLSFIGTGTSFLAYAIICAKRNIETASQGTKTFYFSNGLMEGTETIIFLCLLCLLPAYFVPVCMIFGTLCMVTTAQRIMMAHQVFQ